MWNLSGTSSGKYSCCISIRQIVDPVLVFYVMCGGQFSCLFSSSHPIGPRLSQQSRSFSLFSFDHIIKYDHHLVCQLIPETKRKDIYYYSRKCHSGISMLPNVRMDTEFLLIKFQRKWRNETISIKTIINTLWKDVRR